MGPTQGNLGDFYWAPYALLIRRVLRTRYAAPIGIVDTSGSLAGLVLPFTKYLVHRDSGETLGLLRVEVFHQGIRGGHEFHD